MLTFVHGQLVLLIEYHKSQGRDLFLRDISSFLAPIQGILDFTVHLSVCLWNFI